MISGGVVAAPSADGRRSSRRADSFIAIAVIAFAATLAVGRARAQDTEVVAPEGDGAPTEEVAPPDAPAPAEDGALAEAMTRFEAAAALFDRGDHSGALAEFERIYALLDGHPRRYFVLYNIGQCEEQLFRYDLAVDAYHRYLEEGGREDPDHATVEATLRTLEGLLGTVHVTLVDAEPDLVAEVWVADRQVGVAPGDIRIPGGQHALELRALGHETVRRTVTVSARASVDLSVSLPRLADGHGLSPSFFVVGVVAAAVAGVVGAVLGGVALAQRGDADRCLADPACAFSLDVPGRSSAIRELATGADVSFAVAGALGITAVILALFTDFDGESAPRPGSVSVTARPTGVSLRGSF